MRRLIAESGRARVPINDQMATVQTLGASAGRWFRFTASTSSSLLLRTESHREILDRYAGLEADLADYRAAYERAGQLQARLDELNRRESERTELLELARFRVAELERAKLKPGEDEALARERTMLVNAARLLAAASEAQQLLYGDDGAAVDSVARAGGAADRSRGELDSKIAEPLEMIMSARANLEEVGAHAAALCAEVEADPGRLEEVEARLQELTRLKRKYGGTVESALETLARSRAEMAALESLESRRPRPSASSPPRSRALAARASKLTARRQAAAPTCGAGWKRS